MSTTLAAFDAATAKLQAARDRVAVLQEQERTLSDQIGELIAEGKDAGKLKAKRETVRAELDDLLYAEKALVGRADLARRQHDDAMQAAHVARMQTLAEALRVGAAGFERALVALKKERASFIAAGRALATAAKASGDEFASRFDVENVANDVLTFRVFDRGHHAYAQPVPALIESIIQHLDRI